MNKKKIAVYMCRCKYNSYGFKKTLPDEAFYKTAIEKDSNEFAGLYFDCLNEKDRPALRQMIADYEAGKIDQINVKNISQLERDLEDIFKTLKKLEKLNVYFVNENMFIDSEAFMKILLMLERWFEL